MINNNSDMKRLIYTIALLAFSFSAFGQFNTATSSKDGTWLNSNTWNADPGVSKPPNGAWVNGEIIIIQHSIDIANNKIVDLSTSSLKVLRITSAGALSFGANSQLILPENVTIILEENATLTASNNSNGTLIQIGEKAVWGNQACSGCNTNLEGFGYIDKNSDPNNPLPITLLSFTGVAQNNAVQLDWVTASEENFDFFTVERAGADLKFKAIGKVGGTGNTTTEVAYDFVDNTPLQGQAFYRLKATDFDGSVEYHKIISVFYDGFVSSNTSVYPNPVVDYTFKVSSTTEDTQEISLLDLSGKTVYSITLPTGLQEVTLPETIRPGAYLLMVTGSRGNVHQQKIMVI